MPEKKQVGQKEEPADSQKANDIPMSLIKGRSGCNHGDLEILS